MTEVQAAELIAAIEALTVVLESVAVWGQTLVRITGEGLAPLRVFLWMACALLLWQPLKSLLKRFGLWPKAA